MDGRGRGPRAELTRQAEREAARRWRARRDTLIATGSTIVVIGALCVAILTSKGWPAVRSTFFSWDSFSASFPDILRGFWLDIRLFVIVEIVVLALGLLIALARTSAAPALAPLRILSTLWVDVLRGVPTVLLVYLVGFGVPALELRGVPSSPVVLGGVALAASYSAYVAEVYRAGIDSIHPDQRAAALAVGLTGRQSLRFVVLPQAVRRVVPPLLNDFISLQKDVALVSILGPLDPELVGEVLELIRELKADGMTMVIATHEMAFAREVADEVCFLHDGAILERGAPAQVIDAPSVPETQRFLRRLG